jgi:hypothetical protein
LIDVGRRKAMRQMAAWGAYSPRPSKRDCHEERWRRKSRQEKVYGTRLRGTTGTAEVEVNALGCVIHKLDWHEGAH